MLKAVSVGNTLQVPELALFMIEAGYWLRFLQYLPRYYLRSNLSAIKHPDYVDEAVAELLRNRCITKHTCPPLCLNPLAVVEGKKLRLVIDI